LLSSTDVFKHKTYLTAIFNLCLIILNLWEFISAACFLADIYHSCFLCADLLTLWWSLFVKHCTASSSRGAFSFCHQAFGVAVNLHWGVLSN
jgi:hypothetical protein